MSYENGFVAGLKRSTLQMEPIIQAGNERFVHHMVLYECHVPAAPDGSPQDSSAIFEQHLGTENGANCYFNDMPDEFYLCLTQNTFAWVRLLGHSSKVHYWTGSDSGLNF